MEMLSGIVQLSDRVEVVLIDTYSTKAFYYAWLCSIFCRVLKLPYICILRGGDLIKRIRNSRYLSDQLFKNANSNVALSGYLEKFFKDSLYPVTVIPNFIFLNNYPLNRSVKKTQHHRLLWVRSFHSIYNPEMAVRLVSACEFDGVEMIMVGPDKDGSLEKCRKLAKSLGVENRITFTGKLSKDEWIELGKECGIFINTTTVDNFPISITEAMALGLPVVSTNVGGVSWLLEDGKQGYLVENGNIKEMKKAVLKIINNEALYHRMSKYARQKAEEFDWNKVSMKWCELLSHEM